MYQLINIRCTRIQEIKNALVTLVDEYPNTNLSQEELGKR